MFHCVCFVASSLKLRLRDVTLLTNHTLCEVVFIVGFEFAKTSAGLELVRHQKKVGKHWCRPRITFIVLGGVNELCNQQVLYDDCHALRLFSNALISVVSVISHFVYTLVLSVVVLSNS